jgi:hypothetical protein
MWITKEQNNIVSRYWITDPLPENTEEYRINQSNKKYFIGNSIKPHPGWIYENGAPVDDDYLFYNNGYKLVIDNVPYYDRKTHVLEQHNMSMWMNTEKTTEVTYNIRAKNQLEQNSDISKEWEFVKKIRNEKLLKLDHIVFIALENNLTLSQAFKEYRQKLRDITEDFTDPFSVVWPVELDPFTYYE